VTTAAHAYEQAFAAHQRGKLDDAVAGYEEAIGVDPEHADALHMLGVAHMQKGDPGQAAKLIRRAIRVRPDDARAHSNLASALIAASRFDEAIEIARRATELDPGSADAWGNFGTALIRRNRYSEAIEPLRQALALQPGRAGLHSALGAALGVLRDYEPALESHRRAIELAPDRPQYRNNMALTLRKAGLTGEAEAMLRAIVDEGNTDPDYFASLAEMLRKGGKLAEAVDVLKQIQATDARAAIDRRLTFLQNYADGTTVAEQLEAARQAAARRTSEVERLPELAVDQNPARRLRVGLVSSDLRQHAVALFLLGVVQHIDASEIELFAYSGADSGDDVNRTFRQVIRNWRGTSSLTDAELANVIQSDGIDILLDMSGPTGGGRLGVFARKPAPVSAIWLGYSGTTGHEAVDYIIGDAEVLPEGLVQSTERPWRLPDAFLCFQPTEEPPPVNALPALSNGYVTFGSFNNLSKVSDATMETWAAVLEAVPDSRLVLKGQQGSDAAGDTIIDGLVQRGVARDRIGMLEWVPGWCEHLPLYDKVDIGLDPFPYNGTTTTCESLLMGVPVVTLRGDRFISRVGATLMHNIGLDDWIADSVVDYVELAVTKAQDLETLGTLRAELRQQFLSSPLCDTRRFARNFEAALRGMWRRYCAA
jgi:protein O-GlcNAc transferase